jgi:hypothetical protein
MGDVLKGALEQLLARIADDVAQLLVHAQPLAAETDVGDAYGSLLEGGPESLLAPAQILLVPTGLQSLRLRLMPRRAHGRHQQAEKGPLQYEQGEAQDLPKVLDQQRPGRRQEEIIGR